VYNKLLVLISVNSISYCNISNYGKDGNVSKNFVKDTTNFGFPWCSFQFIVNSLHNVMHLEISYPLNFCKLLFCYKKWHF
jgi:hypothetical protein